MIFILMALRLVMLVLTPLELGGDEAQYWAWSQNLSWGYFSKPPLIAWVVRLSTSVFGDSEAAIRLPALLFHTGNCLMYSGYRSTASGGKNRFLGCPYLYPDSGRSTFFFFNKYRRLPFIFLLFGALCPLSGSQTRIMIKSRQDSGGLLLGIALGLGFLSKYALLFFISPLILLFFTDTTIRKALWSQAGALAIAVFFALITPNLLWNMQHDFATASHTVANANWAETNFAFKTLFDFWSGQLGVFGPIAFCLLPVACVWGVRQKHNKPWCFRLTFFVLFPLFIVSIQAFISRAHANWAASSYIAGSLLVTLWALGNRHLFWLCLSNILHFVFMALLFSISLFPGLADQLGMGNSIKRLRGWKETANTLLSLTPGTGENFAALAFDDRMTFYTTTYYGRHRDHPPLTMWLPHDRPGHQAELESPLPEKPGGPVLLAYRFEGNIPPGRADFKTTTPLKTYKVRLDNQRQRTYHLFIARGHDRQSRAHGNMLIQNRP